MVWFGLFLTRSHGSRLSRSCFTLRQSTQALVKVPPVKCFLHPCIVIPVILSWKKKGVKATSQIGCHNSSVPRMVHWKKSWTPHFWSQSLPNYTEGTTQYCVWRGYWALWFGGKGSQSLKMCPVKKLYKINLFLHYLFWYNPDYNNHQHT